MVRRAAARAATLGAALLLMSGCTATRPLGLDTKTSGGGRTSTYYADTPLKAEAAGGKACFWFERDSGYLLSVVWPVGSSVVTEPLRVVDPSGKELARVGDTDLVLGGSASEELNGCHPGSHAWLAYMVERPY